MISADTLESRFADANALYEARTYDSAIAKYESILAENIQSPVVYFNLGNSYFRNGDLGHAILNYLRAQRLSPSDDDIGINLEFATNYIAMQMEGAHLNPVRGFLVNLVAPYHLNTIGWISSFFFIILFLLLAVRFGLLIRSGGMKGAIWLTAILFLLSASFTTFKYQIDYLTARAVLVAVECPVYSGPTEQSELELEGAPGMIVEILSESGDYFNVQFENGRRGWIRRELITIV